jgi:hypothetical protein
MQLDDFIVFVKESGDETFEYVVTPVREHISIVESLKNDDLT